MTDRFLFQLPQFSSGLRIFLANEAIDQVGLDLAWSHWVNPNARLGKFEGPHLDLSLHCVLRSDIDTRGCAIVSQGVSES